MKRVLITGGAGFIAHHLIGHILETTDWEIITLDRLDYSGNLNRLHDLMISFMPETKRRVKIVHHDLKAELNPLVRSEIGDVDYILHLAAGSHVDRSIDYPMEFVLDNVVGTCNILNLLDFNPTLKDLYTLVLMKYLDLLQMESNIKKRIDTIQLIHIVQQRQVEKN